MSTVESGRFAWLSACLAVAGCAGPLENPERFLSCEPGYVETLLTRACGSCHGAELPQGRLDLVSPDLAARMVEAPAYDEGPCRGRWLMSASGEHLLLDKLEGASCGSPMPLGAAALSSGDLECVRRWIDQTIEGAP